LTAGRAGPETEDLGSKDIGMTLRIAIGGFLHESHSFAPLPTTYADFVAAGESPALARGASLVAALRNTSWPIAGAIAAGEAAGVALLPLTWATASPARPVQDEAFERIAAMICADLSAALTAGPVDGIYLDLHGAMVVDHFPDGEGELLRRVRAVAGDLPLTVSLDPHCNLTAAMVERVDALVPFRTYPHVDMPYAGGQAMRLLLARIARGQPWARAFRQVDFFIPVPAQCTLVAPMKPAMDFREAINARDGVAELAFNFGFPYADFADCGAAIGAYADTQARADAAADEMLGWINRNEATFRLEAVPAAEAVARAISVARTASKPVVIADGQDNPGGGGHGDTTGVLAELIRQGAAGSVLGMINDAGSAAACHAAGVGGTVALSLGGKSDGVPLAVTATVERLSDGNFVGTGPMAQGNPIALGASALIEVAPGVRVILVSSKMQALDQALFTHIGVQPSACKILVLKSVVHFRADFGPIAEQVILATAPGPVPVDPATLPFRHLRPGLRLRPMANAGA
jgi:microcystin degradation protein MlrC